jgi:hypothetical protein
VARGQIIRTVYYGGLSLALAMILTKTLGDVLPGALAGQVSRNSEGLVILLAVSVWIEFVRRRSRSAARGWRIALVAAAAWLGIGLLLRYAPVPSQLATLNEAALALVILVPYLQVRRPLPWWGWLVPLASVAIPLIGGANSVTTDLAEAFGALVLIPLCVDAIDRGILDGSGVPIVRVLVWMAFLVGAAVALHTLVDFTPSGIGAEVFRYIARVTEDIYAALLLHAYFSLLCPGLRREQQCASPADPDIALDR